MNLTLAGPDRALGLGWTPLFSLQPQGVILVDRSGLCLEANPAAVRILGLDRDQLLAAPLDEVLGEVVLGFGVQVSKRVLARTQPNRGTLWLELALQPGPEGSVLVVFHDITETHNQKFHLERMTRLYAALSQVNQAIVWSPTREALFNKICEVMVEFGKFSMAWIGWNDPVTHEVGVASVYGDQTDYLAGLRIRSDDTPLGRGATGSAIRTGRPYIINDFLGSLDSQPWHQAAINSGFASSGSFPISMGGEVVGALSVYAPEKDMFGQDEIDLLVEAAGDISYALDHLQLDARRQEAEAALRDSQARLQKAERVASFGNWELCLTDGTMSASEGAYQIYGLPQHAMALTDVQPLVLPEYRPDLDAALKALLEQGQPYNVEYRICRADNGELRSIHSVAEYDAERKTVFGVILDITDLKQAEQSLKEANQRMYLALDSASQGIWDWDLLAGTMVWDDRMFALYGASREEVRGTVQDWKDGLHPEDLERAIAECEAALRGEAPFHTEFRVQHRDGTTLWIKAMAQVLRDSSGVPVRMLGINQDITKRKLDEEARQKSTSQLRTLIDTLPDLIWLKNPKGVYLECNRRFEQFFGAKEEDIVGKTDYDFVDRELADFFRERDQIAMNAGKPTLNEEEIFFAEDGHIEFLETIKTPILGSGGEIIGVLGIGRNITERKAAEEERARLQAQLLQAQKLESLGSLASGVAHDMNNVLGAILGLASAHLESQPPRGPAYSAFETIHKAADRGGKMVKSLLSFARQSPAEDRELDLNAILREEVGLLERTTLTKVRLELDLAPDLLPMRGDGAALTHAFMNLCINAMDAMPQGGTLILRTQNVDRDWIQVFVEDTGSGMTQEVMDRALDPFFTTKEVGKGTGLGLSIVYSTVKAHRGQMVLQSTPGKGTCVAMRFPTCEPASQSPELEGIDPWDPSQGGLDVLLVDDDELIQSSTEAILEALGHGVTTAPSGEEALAQLEAGLRPQVVILDMNMPGLGGAATLPRIRALRPTVPILLATGRADQAALDLVKDHPFVTLLSKPFGIRDLQQHLEALVKR